MAVLTISKARAPTLRPLVVALGVIAALFPLVVRDEYAQHVAILTLLSAMMGLGWNILGGFAGQLSIGHAAFFGIGAYGATLLFQNWGMPPWFGGWLAAGAGAGPPGPPRARCLRARRAPPARPTR